MGINRHHIHNATIMLIKNWYFLFQSVFLENAKNLVANDISDVIIMGILKCASECANLVDHVGEKY